ncbi:hypothetical protein LbFV_ORF19 [Leptopilina boulardi filamentous virus]|uniref:FCP1 homology domain-containing protein n=1 Tax=Leptopilina boulardi filamentous virus TaxID=552509 RepID=A0A1S5YCZ3_9VIRU|nr:hypothetical protein LbFV_ORF19 [Leptopilina boulardi filamentous virus]AQQ79939.1 hypothetical protein LbFV_ORF19 [Leptopilina boulardi filamentous virus]
MDSDYNDDSSCYEDDDDDDDDCNNINNKKTYSLIKNRKIKKNIDYFSSNCNNNKPMNAIIILDLDETLINKCYMPFQNVQIFLKNLSTIGPIILWTAGNNIHAQRSICTLKNFKFNGVISSLYKKTKSVSVIKKFFPNFINSSIPLILIDDNEDNLQNSGYDICINVKKYYEYSNYNIKNVNYNILFKELNIKINKWKYCDKKHFISKEKININLSETAINSDNEE